jgi:AcrR family transcriptional regulator
VMREKGYSAATVQDILDRADVGTRAFYRHFKSKDDLLHAIYRNDAQRISDRLTQRVRAAGTPRQAVEEWIDELLSLGYNPRQAERMTLIEASIGGKDEAYEQERMAAREMILAPLVAALRAGRRDGSFPTSQPTRDAYLINALVFEVILWRRAGSRPSRRQVTADLLRFCLPALGWQSPG